MLTPLSTRRVPVSWGIIAIILFSFFLRLYKYIPCMLRWDSAEYILMGKYLYSGGASGLWTSYRGIGWPAMLGFFWKMGIDPMLAGKLLMLGFSLGVIFFTYCIGKKIFDNATGLCAALFMSVSPIFFEWGNCLYHHIPTVFFSLLAVIFYTRKKLFFAGLMAGCAFLIRYPHGIMFAVVWAVVLVEAVRTKKWGPLYALSVGFGIFFVPWVISNYCFYGGSSTQPLLTGLGQFSARPAVFYHGPWYYEKSLIMQENAILLLVPVGVLLSCIRKNSAMILISGIGAALLGLYHLYGPQHLHYMIVLLPYFYLLASAVFVQGVRCVHHKVITVSIIAAGVIVLSFSLKAVYALEYVPLRLGPLEHYAMHSKTPAEGQVWISNPSYLGYSDLRVDKLLCATSQADEFEASVEDIALLFFDSLDLERVGTPDEYNRDIIRILKCIFEHFPTDNMYIFPGGHRVFGIFHRPFLREQ